ncbi:MAG: hypothetical protein JW755_03700 [Candidatus Aminicenantes bacterium]|nr:hypothetical protein [Candidatus Aminicenantes bacterium]
MLILKKAILIVFAAVIFTGSVFLAGMVQLDHSKVIGDWEIELDAEGEYFYLSMKVKEEEGKLAGTISEASGFFVDIPMTDIVYDGDNFSFQFIAATPPDGMERIVKGEFIVQADKMEGFIIVDDLGISAPAVAERDK